MSLSERWSDVSEIRTRRALITAPGVISWSETALTSAPGPGQVRVRTRMTLISPGTESRLLVGDAMPLQVWQDFADLDSPTTRRDTESRYRVTPSNVPGGPMYPVSFGYNNIGEVIEVGEAVHDLTIGHRVFTLCRHQEVFDVQEWQAVRIPDSVPDEAAAFGYIATLGLHALRRARFLPGENVAVIGLGLVGLSAALVTDVCGVHQLLCLDPDAERRRMASAAIPGALVRDPFQAELAAELEMIVAPHGIDLVIEAARGSAGLDLALRLLDQDGRVVVAALHPEDLGKLLSSDFLTKEVALLGTGNDPYEDPRKRRTRFTLPANIAYVYDLQRSGRLQLERLRTHTYSVEQIGEVYRDVANGTRNFVGVLLEWS